MPNNSDRTSRLLDSYRLNVAKRGSFAVKELILNDIRRFSELGVDAYVADLYKALFRFDDEECEAFHSPAAYHPADAEALTLM